MSTFEVRPVGHVESPLIDRKNAPRQPDEGAPEATLVFEPGMLPALDGVRAGDRVVVVTWLHRAARETLRVTPRWSPDRSEMGVFATRSPDRPNPIGLHETVVTAVDGVRVRVQGLEAIDGTPIVDLKPVLSPDPAGR
ncbi:MAG: tRNA (N6-threonylcarbamoyladenosine(37)-N6)-methyltransferase TrmO [Longimicrobiales bacterium]